MLRRWFHRWILSRRWATFVVLGLSFFAFGVASINLVYLLKANGTLLIDNGWQAVMDGGLRQLVELVVTAYGAMACYIVFKTCEYHLAHWLGEDPADSAPASIPEENKP